MVRKFNRHAIRKAWALKRRDLSVSDTDKGADRVHGIFVKVRNIALYIASIESRVDFVNAAIHGGLFSTLRSGNTDTKSQDRRRHEERKSHGSTSQTE
jgi:hypothetical protein